MAKYGSPDLTIEVDNSGGTLVDISQYVDTINEFNVEAMLQEGTAFGESWVKQLYTGMRQAQPVTLEGFFDDTATTGPDVILNDIGSERSLKITWGSTNTDTVETIITNYAKLPTQGELTRYRCVLTPTGAVT